MLALIWFASLALSLVSIVVMLALIARRVLVSRRTRLDALLRKRLIGELITFTDDGDADALRPVLKTTAPRLALDAGFEFLGLLRGEVRDRIVSVFIEAEMPAQIRKVLATGNEAERLQAVEMLALLPSEHGIEALKGTLGRDRSSEVRVAAAISLVDLGELPPLDTVLSRIGPDGRRSRRLLALFGRLPQDRMPELEAYAVDETNPPFVRAAVVEALGQIGDPRLNALLLARAAEPDPEIAAASVRGIGRTGGPGARTLVRRALDHPAWQVRTCAAEAAGQLNDTTLADELSRRLDDPVWAVRYAAGKALRDLGPSGLATLQADADSGTARKRRTAALILSEGVIS